ncbi:MAG: sugar ABC transporter ATP-binding protein [Treponema sp.]|jgi:ribose transport system ATP-binding protein|nr:sugar ABC transporter ATP-binding protein [Treponema sp.]
MMNTPVIEVNGISKSFSSTKALTGVSMSVFPGEIRGLIGENGSGKSTLSAIISGNLKADEGTMKLFGEPYAPQTSFDASEKGVSMIVQEQGTIATITAAANIFAGREKQFCKFGLLNSKALNTEAQKLMEKIGVTDIPMETVVRFLSFEERKLVEVARSFYKTPELFIVDETTTALPRKGREILYGLIRQLKTRGKSVLFISHDIEELNGVCDTVTILRDGKLIATLGENEKDPQKMKSLMVGREVTANYYRDDFECTGMGEDPILKVESLSGGQIDNVSFILKKGEILGIAGLSDSGMHELGKMIFGLLPLESGRVSLADGTPVDTPHHAIRNKIGFMSKNRDTESMLISMSIQDNVVLPSLDNLKKFGFFITPGAEKALAKEWCGKLNVKMRDLGQSCAELSGGNKQKIVLAKWLGNGSDIFILDCPTRGIDIGVKEAIYDIMEDLKKQGKSIIMISEELPEIIGMSDRIITIKDGKSTREFRRSRSLTEQDIIQYMI